MPKSSDIWPSIFHKIESRLDKTSSANGCWLWTGATARGYGYIAWDGELLIVHRAYLESTGVQIPTGLELDHLCRVRNCVNPDHLEPVTHQENTKRGLAGHWKRADVCKQGHPFDEANTYMNPSGSRACRACHVVWTREYIQRKKAAL